MAEQKPKTAAQTAAAKAREAKAAKAAAAVEADKVQEPAVENPLAKFLDPEAAAATLQAPVAPEAPVTPEVEEQDASLAPAASPEVETVPEQEPAVETDEETTATVLVDAVVIRPGHIASKGQQITLPASKIARLVGLGAVKV